MDSRALIDLLARHADPDTATQMAAYMRGKFEFLGIPSPLRKTLCRESFRAARGCDVDWEFVSDCWDNPFRELQYVAADYLYIVKGRLTDADLPRIADLVQDKPWWDSIDALARTVGCIALNHPSSRETLLDWSRHVDLWLRRIAIEHQLLRKERTDTGLLEEMIVENLDDKEFFINKAIGWALRDYSKTDPAWVRRFVDRHGARMAPLSIREACKYLPPG